MAGKNPAKLAETGKGCSPRRAGTPTPRMKNHSISMAYGHAPRGTQLALLLASTSWGAGDEWDA
jgi:hypothetical protein